MKTDQQANRRKKGSSGGRPALFEAITDKARHAVECGVNLLKQLRAVTTR